MNYRVSLHVDAGIVSRSGFGQIVPASYTNHFVFYSESELLNGNLPEAIRNFIIDSGCLPNPVDSCVKASIFRLREFLEGVSGREISFDEGLVVTVTEAEILANKDKQLT